MTLRAEHLVMTPERKQRMMAISNKVADLLIAETESPLEAILILSCVLKSLEETSGCKLAGVFGVGSESDA